MQNDLDTVVVLTSQIIVILYINLFVFREKIVPNQTDANKKISENTASFQSTQFARNCHNQ
jgi:hypothetical protein